MTGGENDGGVKSASEKVVEEAKERVREGQKLSEEMFEKVRLSLLIPPTSSLSPRHLLALPDAD